MTTNTKKIFRIFSDTTYTLTKTGQEPSNDEEQCFTNKKIILDGSYDSSIENIIEDIKSQVRTSMKEYYTNHNFAILLPTGVYLLFTLCLWWPSLAPLFCMATVFLFLLFFIGDGINIITIIVLSIFWGIVLFLLGPILETTSIFALVNLYKIGFVIFIIATFIIFYILMYQPTEKGQRATEYLMGLKMFLGAIKSPVIETKKIEEKLNERDMEKLFPYAVALGLEKAWGRKFAKIFGMTNYEKFVKEHSYASDSFRSSFASGLAKSAKKMSSSDDSASSDSISSGSRGDGFAGGGGGGGGGGGR
jgi:uncharacterized membrane protein YgcG